MSSSPSSTSYILFLKSVYKYIFQVGGPILIGTGTIGCVLSLLVFGRKNLRKNPCSIYLLAFNISNLLLLYSSVLSVSLLLGYNITPTLYNLAYCRYNLYMSKLLDILGPTYLLLASIDRMLVTSPHTETRRRSTRRLAFISISGVTIFWILFHIHILFLANITLTAPNTYICYFQAGLESLFNSYSLIVIKVFLLPLLMTIFGLLTMRNIRKVRHVANGLGLTANGTTARSDSQTTSSRSKDRQLFLILITDIIVYIVCSSMLSAVTLYDQLTQNTVHTVAETQLILLLRYTGIFINYISACVGCYTNALISKTFRSEIKKIVLCQ